MPAESPSHGSTSSLNDTSPSSDSRLSTISAPGSSVLRIFLRAFSVFVLRSPSGRTVAEWHGIVAGAQGAVVLVIFWLILYWLYRQRIFIRI